MQTEERRGEESKDLFEIQQRKGKDPYLRAMFVNKREKTIGLKNKTEEEIAILVENVMSEKGLTVKKNTEASDADEDIERARNVATTRSSDIIE